MQTGQEPRTSNVPSSEWEKTRRLKEKSQCDDGGTGVEAKDREGSRNLTRKEPDRADTVHFKQHGNQMIHDKHR